MTYKELKAQARAKAQEWQREQGARPMSWGEAAEWCAHFVKLGKRYGLIKEFRENGII